MKPISMDQVAALLSVFQLDMEVLRRRIQRVHEDGREVESIVLPQLYLMGIPVQISPAVKDWELVASPGRFTDPIDPSPILSAGEP